MSAVECAQPIQRVVIGLPIVEKEPHNGVGGAIFCDGFDIPNGVCRQQNRAVIEGLHKRTMLSRGVSREGKHHDTSITEDIPPLPKLRVVYGRARFDGLASGQPILREEVVQKPLGKAPPPGQGGKFSHAFLRGPALSLREIPQTAHMVGMKVRKEHVCHIACIDLSMRFFIRLDFHSRELGIDGIGKVGCGVMKARGVPCVEQNRAFLRVNQLCPRRKKLDVFSRRTFHGVVGLGPTQTGIPEVQLYLGHDCEGLCQWRNSSKASCTDWRGWYPNRLRALEMSMANVLVKVPMP